MAVSGYAGGAVQIASRFSAPIVSPAAWSSGQVSLAGDRPPSGLSIGRPIGIRAGLRAGRASLPRRLPSVPPPTPPASGVGYTVYAGWNGSAIDYNTPITVTTGTSWSSGPLAVGQATSFGLRAIDQQGGEEKNLDCAVTIELDPFGGDITARPKSPVSGLRAVALAGGQARVEWTYPAEGPTPTSFEVMLSGAPVGSVPEASGMPYGGYSFGVAGLSDGSIYTLTVVPSNGWGSGPPTSVTVIGNATGPAAVDGLSAAVIV